MPTCGTIHCNKNLVVLTHSGLFTLNGRLFKPPAFFFEQGFFIHMSVLEVLLQGTRLRLALKRHPTAYVYRISCGIEAYFLEVNVAIQSMHLLNHHVRNLQRFYRTRLANQQRVRAAQLALLMGTHPRLGASSPLRALDPDLLVLCARSLDMPSRRPGQGFQTAQHASFLS